MSYKLIFTIFCCIFMDASSTHDSNKILGQWYGVYSWPAGKKIFGVSNKVILTNLSPMQNAYLRSLCDGSDASLSGFSEVILATQYVEAGGAYLQIQHLLLGNATDGALRRIIGIFDHFKYLLPITDTKCIFENGFKVYALKVYDANIMLINQIGGKKILVSRKILDEKELLNKLTEIGLNGDGGGPIVQSMF